MPQVQLSIVPQQGTFERSPGFSKGLEFQLLTITLLRPDNLMVSRAVVPSFRRIQPSELAVLTLPAELNWSKGIFIFGAAPIWLYGALVDQVRMAPWVATFDLRTHCGVVVQSSVAEVQVGDTIQLPQSQQLGIAIALCGPPNSGKSVLANALRLAVMDHGLKVYLHRANWDGQGNWTYEMEDKTRIQELVERGKRRLHQLPNADRVLLDYFEYHAQAIMRMRSLIDIVLVDLGGVPDPLKLPTIQACNHSIIISRDPEKVPEWQALLHPHLKPLVVIHSVLESCCEVLQTEPLLELRAGAWLRGSEAVLPKIICDAVLTAHPVK
jgi:CRISPR-associated protein Csx3